MNATTHSAWRIDNKDMPVQINGSYQQQVIPENVGEGGSKIFQLDSELNVIETRLRPAQDFAIITQSDFAEPRMVVTIGLRGNSRFVDKQNEVVFREGYTTITTMCSTIGERQYESGSDISQLRFSFPRTWVERHIDEHRVAQLFDRKDTQVISSKPTEPMALIGAQQMLSSNISLEVAKLYRLGSSMSILAMELGRLWQDDSQGADSFKALDKLIAQRARDLLHAEYLCPPSVEALAKRVGTNSFKLKKLFHHYYDTTPYGMILDIRMRKAHALLLSSGFKVAEIAEAVGYQHAGNFTAAFCKYFGVSPKQIARRAVEE